MALNPIRRTQKLLGAIAIDPNERDEEPQWERTGRVTKLKRTLSLYPYLVGAGVFFVMALLLFFYPILPSAHRSGWTLAVGLFAMAIAIAYWKGRVNAYATLQQYDLNVLFTGRHIKPRLGKLDGSIDDRMVGFKILRRFESGGLRTAFEEFRDRYARTEIASHKDKHHRAESDGSGKVRHGLLKNTTFEADTLDYGIDLFNSVSVTHAGAAEERLGSKNMETAAVIPPVLDSRTSAQVESAFRAEQTARDHSDQELSLVQDQLDRLEEHVDPAGQTLFERTVELIDRQTKLREQERSQSNSTTRSTVPERPGVED